MTEQSPEFQEKNEENIKNRPTVSDEKKLLATYAHARAEKEALAGQLAEAEKALDEAIAKLHENMEARGAVKTAKYDGIGSYTMKEPRVIATVEAEFQEELLKYVRSVNRGDLIKETIHWQTLSAYVKEVRADNLAVPDFINVYLKPSGIFYAAK